MLFNILKKDLKRQKATNIILLIFITLATMFISSSVNNVVSVTTALDGYFDKANVPDYMVVTRTQNMGGDIESIIKNDSCVNNFSTEHILFLSPSHITFENGAEALSGTNILQSEKDLSMNYFLPDESILKKVKSGEIYITEGKAKEMGVEIGDSITIATGETKHSFTFAGTFKDASLGSNMNSVTRYIISENDFEKYLSEAGTDENLGGKIYYINTDNLQKTASLLSSETGGALFLGDRATLKFTYVFDMIITGVLLLVSIILIAISLVVLRFTISFTLSEEFREIGVMRAIGICNFRIRMLYLVKYVGISVIGVIIGLALGIPFGEMLMEISSKSIIIDDSNYIAINIGCAFLIICVVVLFCYGCMLKIRKISPVSAIRDGNTGERFRKKNIMHLENSRLSATSFMAINDILNAPKKYCSVALVLAIFLSLLLIFSNTGNTMKSGTLIEAFGVADCHISLTHNHMIVDYMTGENGEEKATKDLLTMEKNLSENGMPAKCSMEFFFNMLVVAGENKCNIATTKGIGTTTDMYGYTKGTAPINTNEIAITKISANKLGVDIGDTVTIKTADGDKQYIITAFFQSMTNQGDGIRFHQDEKINFIQAGGCLGPHILFTDYPTEKEVLRRMEKIKALYPDSREVKTAKKMVEETIGVTDALDDVKVMTIVLTIVFSLLIIVLMERSFIAKERGEIALLKALGISNGKIYLYHTKRFLFVGILAVITGEIFAMPLTHLCIDPIFKMMGMELAVDYVINPVEMFLIFPLLILSIATAGAFFTSVCTKKIKPYDTVGKE